MALSTVAAYDKDRWTGKSHIILQHKHFAFIAEVIRANGFSEDERKRIAETFANELQATNPNFDWDRFMRAAGAQIGPA